MTRTCKSWGGIFLIFSILLFLLPSVILADDVPDGFEIVEVLTGLESPAGFAFSPDGRMFIGERISGMLRIAKFNADTERWELENEPFYTFDIPKENGSPSRHRSSGLRDIAFDPDFVSNGFVYAFYMKDSPRQNRVVRIQAGAGNPDLANPGSEELLLEVPYNNTLSSGSHNGGAIEFGPDDKLYITTGDGWNGGDMVQSLNTFTGKVFRINSDGSIPIDNPFYEQATGDYRAIYALGLRNPYSMSRHPETGNLYINEAGGTKKASIYGMASAANYGHQGFTGIGTEEGEWGNAANGASGSLVTGGTWYPNDGYWPEQYRGAYFTALWGGNGDNKGNITYLQGPENPAIKDFATSIGLSGLKPVLTRVGPDDNLYYLLTTYESHDGRVHMIRWTGTAGVATPTIEPNGGIFPDPVEVTLMTTTAEADIFYTTDGSTPTTASALYDSPFQVEDNTVISVRAFKTGLNASGTASASFTIGTVANQPPVVEAGNDQVVTVGSFVVLNGANSYDPDNDELTLSWLWTQVGGPEVELFSAEDAVAFFTPQVAGDYEFQLRVSDGDAQGLDVVKVSVVNEPPIDEGLSAYWALDETEGATASDGIGSTAGLLTNGPVWLPDQGRIGGALSFDGIDDYVDLGTLDVSTGTGLTIAFWFNADDFEVPDARFISKASGLLDPDHYWMVSTLEETRLRFRLKTEGETRTLSTPSGVVQSNTWHHIAVTYDGQRMRIYRDAEEVAQIDKVGDLDTNPGVPVALGNQPFGDGDRAFDGLMDDVRMYDRALSANSIAILFNGEVSLPIDTGRRSAPFSLEPNVPNPVRHSTQIAYFLQTSAAVRLEIFDVSGRRVARLSEGVKSQGGHEVEFDATDLPSGVYFYRLTAGGFVQSRIMHILK